jgi:hypothetical protein
MIGPGQVMGARETIDTFGQIPSLLRQAGMAAMTDSLALVSKIVRDDYLQGPYPQEIERRSGSFRATFARGNPLNIWQVQAQGTSILGEFGSKDKRVHILNDGGTIRSSRPGGFLAIRSEFTKTPRGVVKAKYQVPLRQLPNTFVARPKGKGPTVFEKIGKRIVAIAFLVKQVTIKGRKFMQKTEAKADPGVQTIFRERFDTVLTKLQDTLRRLG